MTAETLINVSIPTLAPDETVGSALDAMADLAMVELPLVNVETGHFIGMLSEQLLLAVPNADILLGALPPTSGTAVRAADHILAVLANAAATGQTLIAVTDVDTTYIGAIQIQDLATRLGQGIALQLPGGILELSVAERDYSLSQISRLVESNEAKILTSYIEADTEDRSRLRVILRINQTDLTRIIATLERFSYNVTASYHMAEATPLDQERLDSLLKYLSI
jgi:acetoin utilization protein AcuB